MDHAYWTYIVASLSGTLYLGVTNNIERRMREQKSGEFKGFASKYHCTRLVYCEAFDGKHTPHLLSKSLSWHGRYLRSGQMKARARQHQVKGHRLTDRDCYIGP